jgi:hypothetical protein
MLHLKSILEIVEFVPRQNKGGYFPDIVTNTHTAVALDRKLLAQLHAMSYLKNTLEIVDLSSDENRWFLAIVVNLFSLWYQSGSKEELRQCHMKAQHGILQDGTCLLDLMYTKSGRSLLD